VAVRLPAPVRRLAESVAGTVELREQVVAEQNNVELLKESVYDLERQLFEPGWIRLTAQAEIEFSPEGLVQLRAICRLYALKNPLIKRGLALRGAYVWGQGVEITARANGKQAGEQDVQAVVDQFLTDDANARAVTGSAARERLERTLGTDGEVYLCLFTRPMTGAVQVRTILADEIVEVISNPEDRSEPWYFRRRWVQTAVDPATGSPVRTVLERLYPAVDYRPMTRPKKLGQVAIAWDSPVLQVKVGDPEGWDRGIPDCYAGLDWARAYKEFLEDWGRLMRSLSRFAWKATTPGSKSGAVKARLAEAPSRALTVGGDPNAAGATAILSPDVALEAISKNGATIDAESGRPLAMMVASALGVPVTMLLSDPGQTGARATAETLDEPTENEMGLRRELWSGVYKRILRYVIAESVRAPQGALKGTIKRDQASGRETVTLAGNTDDTIDMVWPPLDKVTPDILVKAITEAAGTGTLPPEVIARLLLTALGVRDVDEILDQLMDDDGNFTYPAPPDIGGTGQAAADAARAGQDPAAVLDGGPMQPGPDDGTGGGTGGQGPGNDTAEPTGGTQDGAPPTDSPAGTASTTSQGAKGGNQPAQRPPPPRSAGRGRRRR
jgi:hypothetical protein